MVKIKKQLVSSDIASKVTSGTGNGKKFITIHTTGNKAKTADAQRHANLQSNGNSRSASWHWSCDSKEAIQSFEHKYRCWHCGDGLGNGNGNSIGIEICVNEGDDHKKAIQNAADLARSIMKEEGISINNVKQHFDWVGKDCPYEIRHNTYGINWAEFKKMITEDDIQDASSTQEKSYFKTNPEKVKLIKNIYLYKDTTFNKEDRVELLKKGKTLVVTEVIENSNGVPRLKVKGGYITASKEHVQKVSEKKYTSLVDYLEANGEPHEFNDRAKLAKQHGIKDYKGTADQNTKLLNILQG